MRDMRTPTVPLFVPIDQEVEFRARFSSLSADDSSRPEVEIVENTFFDGDLTPWRETKSYKQNMDATMRKLTSTVLHKTPKSDREAQPTLSVSSPMDIVAGDNPRKPGGLSAEEIDFAKRHLRYVVNDRTLRGRTVVMIDPQKLQQSFRLDSKYVGELGANSRRLRSKLRYAEIRRAVAAKAVFPVPLVELRDAAEADLSVDLRSVPFTETIAHFKMGSHLFAFLRDIQCPAVPVAVALDDAKVFREQYGSGLLEILGENAALEDDFTSVWKLPNVEIRKTGRESESPKRTEWRRKSSPLHRQ